MPRTAPHQTRSSRSIEQILDAAERVINERGYASVTTAHIAEAAGISVGRVYYWFETKEAVVKALSERNQRVVLEVFADLLNDNAALSTPELVESIVSRTITIVEASPSVLFQLAEQPAPDDATGAGALADLVRAGVAGLIIGRVPETPAAEAAIVASTIVQTVVAGVRAIWQQGDADGARATELTYIVAAYLACRMPATESPHSIVAPARRAHLTVPLPAQPLQPYIAPPDSLDESRSKT